MTDVMKMLKDAGFQPEVVVDDGGFNPVKGEYLCRIDKAGRLKGIGKSSGQEYDFRTMSIQVAEVIAGDKATNRYFNLSYNLDEKGVKKLLNDLFTANIEVKATSDEELDTFLETLKDKTMFVRAWVAPKMKKVVKDGQDTWEKVEPREDVQKVKVVKDFKGKSKPEKVKSNVPF